MSDTNRTSTAIVEESTFGTTPATPAWVALRVTGNNLTNTPQTVISNEIRADRQVTDLILVGVEAGGSLPHEVSFDAQEVELEAIMADVWMNKPTKKNLVSDSPIEDVLASTDTYTVDADGTDFTTDMLVKPSGFAEAANNALFKVTSSTGTTVVAPASPGLTDEAVVPVGAQLKAVGFEGASGDITTTAGGTNSIDATTLDFTTLSLSAGQWIKVGGTAVGEQYDTAANNDWVRISSVTASTLELDIVPTGWTTDAGAGKTIRIWFGDYIRNGTTKKFYSIETQFQDHSPISYRYHRGMVANVHSVTFDSQAIVTASTEWLGQDAVFQTTRFTGSTDLSAPDNQVMNSSSNVGRIAEDGVEISGSGTNEITNVTMNFNANARGNPAIGSLGFVNVGLGSFTVTGSITTYFDDPTLADKPITQDLTSLDIRVQDSSADLKTLVYDLPRLKFGSGDPDVPGPNADVTLTSDYTAFRHETLGYTAQVQRFFYTE